jgi:hypothetical protein
LPGPDPDSLRAAAVPTPLETTFPITRQPTDFPRGSPKHRCRTGLLHSSSPIPHPSSFILHPSSFILHPSSLILHPSSFIPHPSSLILHPSSFTCTDLPAPLTRTDLPAPAIPEGCQSIAGGRSPAQTSGSRSPCHASRRDARDGIHIGEFTLGQVRCGSRNAGPARSHMRVSRFFPWFPILASLRDAAVRGAATCGSPSTPGALPDHRTATHGSDRPSLRDHTGSACQNESPKKYPKNTPPPPSLIPHLIPHPSSLIPHPSSLTYRRKALR